ncbi:MAG: CoA transferase [Dehalococcoidia bacterium]
MEGYRVIDLSEGVAGPYTAMALGDADADVIKVESPEGDRARGWGPPRQGDQGHFFLSVNRNKRGIVLDLAREEGRDVARRLLERADVVVVDPNRLPHPDLSYEAVGALNPQIVYRAISGFGDQGPWAGLPEVNCRRSWRRRRPQAARPIGEPPVRHGLDIASMYSAVYSVQAVCAALLGRDRIGSGQRIDVSLFAASLPCVRRSGWRCPIRTSGGASIWRATPDRRTTATAARTAASTSPGAYGPREVRRLAARPEDGMGEGRPTLPRAANGHSRRGGQGGADGPPPVGPGAVTVLDRGGDIIERHGGLAFPMNDYKALVEDEQVQYLNMVQTIDQPGVGPIRVLAPPWQFAETPAEVRLPAPRLGEHGREILAELGLTPDAIDRLSAGALGA